jgi:hypothetical protein
MFEGVVAGDGAGGAVVVPKGIYEVDRKIRIGQECVWWSVIGLTNIFLRVAFGSNGETGQPPNAA